MAIVTFRSNYRRHRVYFPPEKYGSIETAEMYTDRAGNLVIDAETQRPMMKKAAVPVAQFEDNMLTLDDTDPIQKRQIECLRAFITDGRASRALSDQELYEEEAWVTQAVAEGAGQIVVTVPEELDDDDRALLFGNDKGPGLMTYFHNPIPKPAINKAMDLLDAALQRYEVRGIYSPTPERAEKQVRSRIVDLVYALQDAGLPLKTESRKAHSEAMQAEGGGAEAQPSA